MTEEQVTGPAVVGSGQYLAWTPCCHRPVRLTAEDVRPRNVVCCPRHSRRWALSYQKRGVDWVAVWVPQQAQPGTADQASGR